MEKAKFIQIGWLRFQPKLLTFQQIVDAGKIFSNKKKDKSLSITNAIAEMLANSDDASMMQEMLSVMLFRNRLLRWIMRPYVKHYATVKAFRELLAMLSESNEPALFITQIFMLKGTNTPQLDIVSVQEL